MLRSGQRDGKNESGRRRPPSRDKAGERVALKEAVRGPPKRVASRRRSRNHPGDFKRFPNKFSGD